jgi:hypothetical protein
VTPPPLPFSSTSLLSTPLLLYFASPRPRFSLIDESGKNSPPQWVPAAYFMCICKINVKCPG